MAYYPDPNQGAYGQPPQYGAQYGIAPQQSYGQYAQPNYAPQPGYAQPQPPPQTNDDMTLLLGLAPQVAATGPTDPLVRQSTSQRIAITKMNAIAKREVFLHRNFDIDTLPEVEGLQDMKYSWQFKWETILALWLLFNSVSTIMIILTNFSRSVDPAVQQEYGSSRFNILMSFITYFPLVYFLVVILLVNNYYSEITFYTFLKHGCIIDFPESASLKQLFTSVIPLLFILLTLAYFGVVIGCFVKFKASVGVVLIFINNLLVGIGMSWYRQQSIESKFVSVSNFIQAFPDREDEYGNMDEQSLYSASRFIENMTLTESERPSYSSYMREYVWKHENTGPVKKVCHHLMLFFIICAMAGACVAYFIILRGLDVKSTWSNTLNPCISVCASSLIGNGYTNAAVCNKCTCDCMAALSQKTETIFDACSDYGSVSVCSALKIPLCPANYTYCGFINN